VFAQQAVPDDLDQVGETGDGEVGQHAALDDESPLGSADLAFDHAGERTVTDGGAVVGQTTLLTNQPALV
jgi:hypothetical protein